MKEQVKNVPILHLYEDYYKFNKVPMYELYNVSPNFYGNIFILKWAIEVLGANSPTVYGALRRDTKVAYEDIVISKYEIRNNVDK